MARGAVSGKNVGMTIRAVAFDVHNALMRWPADRLLPGETQRWLAEWGIEISYQAYEAARYSVLVLDAPKRKIEGWTDFLALLFARMGVPLSVDLLTCLTAMHEARDHMECYPDTLPALRAAKSAGLTTCTFTTLPPFMLGRRATEVRHLLDHYFDCSTVGLAKGDRRFYRRITEQLGVQPSEVMCVGDDPVGDCLIPGELGWQPVLLDRHARHAETRAGQIATIRTLAELEGVVRERNARGADPVRQ